MKFTSSPSKSLSQPWLASLFGLLLGVPSVNAAIPLDITSEASIKNAAAIAAQGLVSWYNGNDTGGTPGNLPAPYYWWEAGAMFMSLIDYWYMTGDTQYNDITTQAILWQVGTNDDFMTANQTKTEGNDDQSFWAFAAMEAAELGFPNPPSSSPQWLALAQAVFNLQANRWDTSTCGGGLRWQIYEFNAGYTYKNTISNGCFFSLAARLARYTGNSTYSDWAVKMWDWTVAIGLQSSAYEYFDGSDDTINCTQVNHIQWTYNAGVFLHGASTMWNITSDPVWKTRVEGIVAGLDVFFENDIMYEVACETNGKCDNDQMSFKAYLSRWMAVATQLAPFTSTTIKNYLAKSAVAAAEQCSGGTSGEVCGLKWIDNSTYDGTYGPGQQMAAMQVFAANLIDYVAPPLTNDTGGTSVGNPSAGTGSSSSSSSSSTINDPSAVTTGDRVAAGFLTTFVLGIIIAGAAWMAI